MVRGLLKQKKYRVYFSATITGYRDVEAFDEEDAEEKVRGVTSIDDFDDNQIFAEVDEIVEIKDKKRKKK